MLKPASRQPDFENIQLVLDRKCPKRPTLFELFLNGPLTQTLAGTPFTGDALHDEIVNIKAHENAGYDYVAVTANSYTIRRRDQHRVDTLSLNDNAVVFDRESFDRFVWPDPDAYDYSKMDRMGEYLPEKMKIIVSGPDGIFENVVKLTGYENLCYMLYDEPELVSDLFEQVGTRVVRYYERSLESKNVGAIVIDDDWGFHSQTLLPASALRQYVFPWYQKVSEMAHASGRQVILHSCGNYAQIIEDIIEVLKIDGRHSYEDKITPVEEAYRDLHGRLAVLGGIDIDFMATKSEEEITRRCREMLDLCAEHGGYALGTGNSIPEYIPDSHYFAMTRAALKE